MPDYKAIYFRLFAATADAVEKLEQQNYGDAKNILISAQQETEEQYLSQE